jgi:circadian clock protein KaiB
VSSASDEWIDNALSSTGPNAQYRFTLYVVGTTPRTSRAIVNLRELFETHLANRYLMNIIDIAQNPQVAVRQQVVAVPMLVREEPLPARRFVGDMSDTNRLLRGLEIVY